MMASPIAKKIQGVENTPCKLPAVEKAVAAVEKPISKHEDHLTVDLFKQPGGPGGSPLADKALGVMALMKSLLLSFGAVNKATFELAINKSLGLEEGRIKNEDLLSKRTKLAILTALTLTNNQRSLPISLLATAVKLPPAIKPKQPEGLKHEAGTI